MPELRCDTCAFWARESMDLRTGWAVCEREMYPEVQDSPLRMQSWEDIQTAPDFGCIQWLPDWEAGT